MLTFLEYPHHVCECVCVCQGPWASHDWTKHEGRMQSAPGADIMAKPCQTFCSLQYDAGHSHAYCRLVHR